MRIDELADRTAALPPGGWDDRAWATPMDDPADRTRTDGLRRLSRLTWRATQLSALGAAAFAVVFARTAPAQTASQATVQSSGGVARPAGTAAPGSTVKATVTPSASRPAPATRATTPAAAAPAAAGVPAAGTPAAQPSSAAAAPPTLAPPASPPAPAPSPSPVQTTSSGSHSGG